MTGNTGGLNRDALRCCVDMQSLGDIWSDVAALAECLPHGRFVDAGEGDCGGPGNRVSGGAGMPTAQLRPDRQFDIHIEQSDLRIDTYCASGPGGQCVNTTYSAVRITHLPTNTVVQSQEQRSQIQNREVCMQMLRARLYEMELEKQQAELGAERQSQIGHGNRSEKIRTYNQPQDRVTDHRIGFNSTYNGVLLGDQLGTVIEALAAAERAEKLAQAV